MNSTGDVVFATTLVGLTSLDYYRADLGTSRAITNFTTPQTFSYSDEFAALVAMNIIPVAAAGNSFFTFNSVQGVGSVASDASVLAVGAVYDEDVGRVDWLNGQGGPDATDFTPAPDRVASFSQRHSVLSDIFAPGPMSTGARTVAELDSSFVA